MTGCFQEDITSDLRGVEDMFVPKDLDTEPVTAPGAAESVKKKAKKEWKLRRERAKRLGKQKVDATVRKWRGTFENSEKYFKIGRVKSADEGELGPVRKLCEYAEKQRPQESKEA